MKMKQRVGRMKMKQQWVGRTNEFVLGFFSWSNHRQGTNRTRGELGMGPASRFVVKRTVQIDRQREQTSRDNLTSVRIKLTIATL
jgi:hypothetical protein